MDIKKEHGVVKALSGVIKRQTDLRGFSGLFELPFDQDHLLAISTDGVGSKVLIAAKLDKWDTIGIDCIAMNVNDLICLGAEPFLFVDYLAIEKMVPTLVEEIVKGLVKGAQQSRVAIIGGETATMPQVIKGHKPERGFDLAGMALGMVKKDEIIGRYKVGDMVSLWFNPDEVFIFKKPKDLEKELSLE